MEVSVTHAQDIEVVVSASQLGKCVLIGKELGCYITLTIVILHLHEIHKSCFVLGSAENKTDWFIALSHFIKYRIRKDCEDWKLNEME